MSDHLTLEWIRCVKTEDDGGADELRIELDGKTVWGASMDNGEVHRIYETFKVGNAPVEITLVDGDNPPFDNDDVLGRQTVGYGEGVLEFTRDEANYKLSYKLSS